MTARRMDAYTVILAGTAIALLMLISAVDAHGQVDPCDACIADWSWAECPCLPVTEEPPPPITETHSTMLYMPYAARGE